jgi:hypothetical protein
VRKFLRARYAFTALDGAGVRWWASQATTESAAFNALVHGGRCHNERPDEYRMRPGLDVDIVGCYGTTLRSLIYPIGLPTPWSFGPNDVRPTLGEWWDSNHEQLVDGLWTCTVSGYLSFEQDLLHSKLVKRLDLHRAADPHADIAIPSHFPLLRHEVQNAVVTADIFRAMLAAATTSEKAEILQLKVVTAAAYLKKDRLDSIADWCREVLAAPAEPQRARRRAGLAGDNRPRSWTGVPLEGFIGKLADERQRIKEQRRTTSDTGEQRRLDGLQTVLKLLVNTLYGVLASRHFRIGNTILANTITGRARVGVWMLSKALGLYQSITDGGPYAHGAVPHWKDRRPGLDTLSRMWDWHAPRRGRTLEPVPGLDWQPGQPLTPDQADAALAHVRQFWAPYGLDFPFELEHKYAFIRAAYWNKADQALLLKEGEPPKYSLRGKNYSQRGKNKKKGDHSLFALLDNILAGKDIFPDDLSYQRGGLLKVASYRQAQASATGYADIKDLRPGDDKPKTEHIARYNNVHFPLADAADFHHRADRRPLHHGDPVEFFERYRRQGIAAVHAAMQADKLRLPVVRLIRPATPVRYHV